jgi:hypothetical protein
VGEKPGLSGAAFFDLYTDPREESGKMLPTFPAKDLAAIKGHGRYQFLRDMPPSPPPHAD